MKIAIVGSREFKDYKKFKSYIEKYKDCKTIVSGGAKGADSLAEKYASEKSLELIVFPADWKKFGLSAGPKRNQEIVDFCDFMIAFPSFSGKGTQDSINKCKKAGKKCYVYELKINGYNEDREIIV